MLDQVRELMPPRLLALALAQGDLLRRQQGHRFLEREGVHVPLKPTPAFLSEDRAQQGFLASRQIGGTEAARFEKLPEPGKNLACPAGVDIRLRQIVCRAQRLAQAIDKLLKFVGQENHRPGRQGSMLAKGRHQIGRLFTQAEV
jgi:hypothetical protein